MKLAFSAMKDEGPDVLEWVCYQRAVGFDEVLVYTNDCTDGSDDLLDALNHARGHLQREVAQHVRMRRTPMLEFRDAADARF